MYGRNTGKLKAFLHNATLPCNRMWCRRWMRSCGLGHRRSQVRLMISSFPSPQLLVRISMDWLLNEKWHFVCGCFNACFALVFSILRQRSLCDSIELYMILCESLTLDACSVGSCAWMKHISLLAQMVMRQLQVHDQIALKLLLIHVLAKIDC